VNRISVQAQLLQAQHLLRHIAEDYYTGATTYHTLTPKTVQRAYWHVRLKTLTQIGSSLADALNSRRPHWELLYHLAGREPRSGFNPFQAGGGCHGCHHHPPGGER